MFTDKDKAIAEYLIKEKIISQDQLLTLHVEVDCRGPGSLLNVLLHNEVIDVQQMIKIINAVKAEGGFTSFVPRQPPFLSKISGKPFPNFDDDAVTRQPGELRPVTGPCPSVLKTNLATHSKSDPSIPNSRSEITRKPLLEFNVEAPTRRAGELRAVTGPTPSWKIDQPASKSNSAVRPMVPKKPDSFISRTQERRSPVPHAGFLAANFLKDGLGALEKFERSIQRDTDIPKAKRMSLITYVYKARVAFEEMQKRMGVTEED